MGAAFTCASRRLLLGTLGLASLATLGCYGGSAHAISPRQVAADPGWVVVDRVPLVRQRASADCGSAALAMVLSYWASPTSVAELDELYPAAARQGWRAGQLRALLREKGLDAFLINGKIDDLTHELRHGRPVVVGVVKRYGDRALTHYQVVVGVNSERGRILTLDPADGWREDSVAGFDREWGPSDRLALIVMPRSVGTAPPAPESTSTTASIRPSPATSPPPPPPPSPASSQRSPGAS